MSMLILCDVNHVLMHGGVGGGVVEGLVGDVDKDGGLAGFKIKPSKRTRTMERSFLSARDGDSHSTHQHVSDFSLGDKRNTASTRYTPTSPLADARGLLATGLLEGLPVTYRFSGVSLKGFVKDVGYLCGCSMCKYTKVIAASKFAKHARLIANNQNDHIFLDSGISIYKLSKKLAGRTLGSLDEVIEEAIHLPPNMEQFEKWKASFPAESDRAIATNVDKTQHVDSKLDTQDHLMLSTLEKETPVVKEMGDTALQSMDDLPPCSTLINNFKRPLHFGSKRGVETVVGIASDNTKQRHNEVAGFKMHIQEKESSYLAPNMNQQTKVLKYAPSCYISDVKSLLSTGILEGISVVYKKDEGKLDGVISNLGYRCGCFSCKFSEVLSALAFEKHAGATSNNPNDYIFLKSGITMYKLVKNLKERQIKLGSLDKVLQEEFQIQPSIVHFENWKVLFMLNMDQKEIIRDVDEAQLNQPEMQIANHSVKRNGDLHQLIFKENGLPDGFKLTYCIKGETIKTGYKFGDGIMCDCCNQKMKPSVFEAHAGFPQRRQPYKNIYTSDGTTLHDLSIALFNSQNSILRRSRIWCTICGTGGELFCCDGCTKSFHKACLKLQGVSNGKRYCSRCIHHQCRSGSAFTSSGAIRSTKCRSRLILKAGTDEFLCCTLCKDASYILDVFGEKTIIFCTQCEREYHIGCLKDHGICDLKEVPVDCKWFCSGECDSTYAILQGLVNDGESSIPDELLSMLKSPMNDLADDLKADIHWQILNGNYVKDYSLLSKIVGVFHEELDPIVEDGEDFIAAMVHAKDAVGKLLEGVYCATITVKSVIVSAGMFRAFGQNVAELPLVVTCENYRGKGYFRVLYSIVEQILSRLDVKHLIVPTTKDVQSLWIDKLGFSEMMEEKLQAYLKDYPLIMFENTTILEKAIPRLCDMGALTLPGQRGGVELTKAEGGKVYHRHSHGKWRHGRSSIDGLKNLSKLSLNH
ncbi:hypothetical protein Cni_G23661 [Canna indica]|uniref:Uncharacterized protein n=1 Tax=Canna indica TaxID=4628 RepID=A0AAQ3QNT7_9LILI|nr:hypothetical protein Cni_G23661 [Canna indica]